MNRQLKRANEKSDKRREREQTRRKEQRRESRVKAVQAKRSTSPKKTEETSGKTSPSKERSVPGMGRSPWAKTLATIYLFFVASVIVSQAFLPRQTDTLSLVVHTSIYLILGYFLVLWLYRRGVAQALAITLAVGLGLAFGVEGLKSLLPQLSAPAGSSSAPNLIFVALAVPGLLLGAFLGRYIFRRS